MPVNMLDPIYISGDEIKELIYRKVWDKLQQRWKHEGGEGPHPCHIDTEYHGLASIQDVTVVLTEEK